MKKRNRNRALNLKGFDRRTFLKAAGLAGLGAGLSGVTPNLGLGQDTGRPKRVIFLMTELGWNPYEFRMAPPGAPDEVLLRSAYHPQYRNDPDELRWELDLVNTPREEWSPTLRPLYDLREYTLALDGLGMLSIGADQYGDAHAKGWNHALSGHPSSSYITGQRAVGGAPSIDRRLAHHFEATEPELTDLSTLRLDVGPWWGGGGTGGFHHWYHDLNDAGTAFERYPTIGSPGTLWERLFGTASSGDSRSRILGELEARYRATYPSLGRDGRARLDQHRQRLSDIQARIATLGGGSCTSPAEPQQPQGENDERYMANLSQFIDLLVVAMSCDITRMASIAFSNSGVQASAYGAADRDFHEWYSHGTNPPTRWRGVEGANVAEADYDKWLDAAPVIANKNRFHMTQVAQLAQRLRDTPDGEGNLLDSTLIVLMDEISHGSHGHDQWPVVLVGGFGGEFRTGRYVRFPRNNPSPGINDMGPWVGQPHNQLLISILQGFGVEIDNLDIDAVYARGGRRSGQRISLTGRLHELY